MTGKFEYSLLQYVHHQLWGEVFNLGILFYFPDSQRFEFQAGNRWKKLGHIYPDINIKRLGLVLKAFDGQAGLLSDQRNFEGALGDAISKYFVVRESATLQFGETKSGWILDGSPVSTRENYIQLYFNSPEKKAARKHSQLNTDHRVTDYLLSRLKLVGLVPTFRQRHPEELSYGYASLSPDLVWQNGSLNYTKSVALDLESAKHAKDKALLLQAQLNNLEPLAIDKGIRFDLLISLPKNREDKDFADIPKILEDIKASKKLVTVDKIDAYISELKPYL